MEKHLILWLLPFVLLSCWSPERYAEIVERQEREAITDSTIIIDISKCSVDEMPLSKLVCDVEYLRLEAVEGSYLTSPINIKLSDSLIYVLDLDEHLRCFDRRGKFVRNAYKKGNGHGEINGLYDFDVDEDYLYLLDGVKSAVVRCAHNGEFIDARKLPFRATRFKRMYNGTYLFKLAPFTLSNEQESQQIAFTDSNFNVIHYYIPAIEYRLAQSMIRTPYFDNCKNAAYYAPMQKRSIYQLRDTCLFMKYYLEFNSPYYEPGRKVDGIKDAQSKEIFYTNQTPMQSQSYLMQHFYTSRDVQGLLLINLHNNKPIFVRKIVNDTDYMIRYVPGLTKFYDVSRDRFVGISDAYTRGIHSDQEIEEGTAHLSDSIKSILVSNDKEADGNPLLMFYRLKDNLVD